MTRHYLDHASTSPVHPEAVDALSAALNDDVDDLGRIHHEGMVARHTVEEAREHLAAMDRARSREVVFTSGATEAMGVDAHRSLRLSVGWCSTQADVEAATTALPGILQDLRALRHDPHDRLHDRP